MAKKKSAAKPTAKSKTRAKAKNLAPKSAGKVKGGILTSTVPRKLYE